MLVFLKLFLKVFLFSFSLVCVQSAMADCKPSNKLKWDYFELKDRVKEIHTYKVTFEKDKQTGILIKGKSELEDKKTFDIEGNSNVYLGSRTSKQDTGLENYRVEYVCNSDNKISAIKYISETSKSFDETLYKYDKNRRLKEKSEFFSDGTLYRKEVFEYDIKGKLIEEKFTQQVHPEHFRPMRYDVYVKTKSTYKYDKNNNLIERKGYRGDTSLYSTVVYKYNTDNNITKYSYFDKEGNLEKQHLYKYEGKNLIELIEYQSPCINRICENPLNSGEGFFDYATKETYKYDSKGNWIEKAESIIGIDENLSDYQLEAIYTRKIFYYKD